jgi:hypothetical protein
MPARNPLLESAATRRKSSSLSPRGWKLLAAYPVRVPTLARVLLVVVWAAFMIGMANWSYTDGAMVGAAAGTLTLGLVVGRWWAVLVPLGAGIALAVATLLADPDAFHENSPGLWAAYVLMWTLAISGLVAMGVALSHLIARGRRRWRGARSTPRRDAGWRHKQAPAPRRPHF